MNPAPLDGNVAAGDLADIFAFDTTTAITTLRHLPPHSPDRDPARLPAGTRNRAALRLLRRRPNPPRARPRTSMARPARHSTCSRSRCPPM